ncbi:aminoglycoside phosphotransferase family protein [Streptomyces sp. Q6]|uniref:Aminoglycoside phosphotransferase family protein n=1 Tax=Streptomyces citrinus TaxID=3118173 RepID=A0ACD5AC94_9ACTN
MRDASPLSGTPGLSLRDVMECEPLSGGTYNTLFRVVLRDGRRWVIKLPPSDGAGTTMAYEYDLLHGEAVFYAAAAPLGLPIPVVLHAEVEGDPGIVSCLVMTERPGTPWHLVDGDLRADERRALREELGGIAARLHGVSGDAFGYPAQPFGAPSHSWREAFTGMLEGALDDAVRYGARLPRSVETVRAALASAAYALDEVDRPALVHFDLWQGNVLLTGEPGARRIGGVIDGERMFWGDPLAEFVSLALFGDIEQDRDFLAGYAAAGGEARFTGPARLRLALYRCYLYLIMLVEAVPRRYGPAELDRTWRTAGKHFAAAVDEAGRG